MKVPTTSEARAESTAMAALKSTQGQRRGEGHGKERCWFLHLNPKPEWWKEKGQDLAQAMRNGQNPKGEAITGREKSLGDVQWRQHGCVRQREKSPCRILSLSIEQNKRRKREVKSGDRDEERRRIERRRALLSDPPVKIKEIGALLAS